MAGEAGEGRPSDPFENLRKDFTFSEGKAASREGAQNSNAGKAGGERLGRVITKAIENATPELAAARLLHEVSEKAWEKILHRPPGSGKIKVEEIREWIENRKKGNQTSGEGTLPPGELPQEPPKPPERRGGEEGDVSSLGFEEVQRRLDEPGITPELRQALGARKETLVHEVENFKRGDVLRTAKIEVTQRVKESTWDNYYANLQHTAQNLDDQLIDTNGAKPEWRGAIYQGVMSEVDRLAASGIKRKEDQVAGSVTQEWLENHHFGDTNAARLRERAEHYHIWNVLPGHPEELVGASISKQPSYAELTGQTEGVNINEFFKRMEQFFQSHTGGYTAEQLANEYAKAMGVLTPEQQKEMYVRAEEAMVPLPAMDVEVPGFLLGEHRSVEEFTTAQEEWKARARLVTAAANKRMAPSYDKLFPNQESIDISRDNLKYLMMKKGVMEAASAYTALIAGDMDPNILFSTSDENELVHSIFDITNNDQLKKVRAVMREWLHSNKELGDFNEEEARVAEHVAWNLIYLSNMVEEYDSRYEHENAHHGRPHDKRIPPAVPPLKSPPVWMMMHPQERLEGKVGGGEAFSVFGEWALNGVKGAFPEGKIPEILPRTMFRNALRDIVFDKETPSKKSLFEVLQQNGDYFKHPEKRGNRSFISSDQLHWESIDEGPFGPYNFDVISKAITVFSIIDKGKSKDKDIVDLGDALRKLNVDNDNRGRILMAWVGIDSVSSTLRPGIGWISWNGFLSALKKGAPNFFK